MRSKKLLVLVFMGLLLGSFALALAQDEEESGGIFEWKAQTTCPVTGDPIDKQYFVDAYGKRIYVCSAECMEYVKQDTDKYIDQLEMDGVELEDAAE